MKGAKDKVPNSKVPGVVYAIGCKDCPKVHIGETARTAEQRCKEHNAHFRFDRTEQSVVACHVFEANHEIYWEPLVIDKERLSTRRKVKDALNITKLKEKGVMNQDSGLQLSKLWLDLVG